MYKMFQLMFDRLLIVVPYWKIIQTYLCNTLGVLYDMVYILTKLQFECNDDSNLLKPVDIVEKKEKPTQMEIYVALYKDKLSSYSGYTRNYEYEPQEADWKHLLTSILIEYTPLGNVLMYYDSSKDSFVYFSDRNIPYECIDTVARRYVLTYNCTILYIDSSNPDSACKKSIVLTHPNTNQSVTELKDNVYVKLKTYRAPRKENTINTIQKINRYTYGGKMANFLFLKKNNPIKKLSYLDYKNKINKVST
jgi:hypothetical protein